MLKSGATIRVGLRALEEIASKLIADCADKIAAVSKQSEAFALFREAIAMHMAYLENEVEPLAEKAGERRDAAGLPDSGMIAAMMSFKEISKRLERQLELHRFTFTEPAPITETLVKMSPLLEALAATESKPKAKNKGGRPPAPYWDDMWADIAAALYAGDLVPKTQSEIENAMIQLIERGGFEASTSNVRARARKLWDRLGSAG